jgi:hypothetical protein
MDTHSQQLFTLSQEQLPTSRIICSSTNKFGYLVVGTELGEVCVYNIQKRALEYRYPKIVESK